MTTRLARTLYDTWSAACVAALVVLIGVRWLRYTTWSALPSVDEVVRRVMVIDTQTFLWLWGYAQFELPSLALAALVAALALHRRLPGLLAERRDEQWQLTPLALALLLSALLASHYMIDVTPTVFGACVTSLPLAFVLLGRPRAAPLPRALSLALWALFVGAWVAYAGDAYDRLAIGAWMLVLVLTERWLAPAVRARDLALARVLAIIPVNLIPAMLPLVVPPNGATYVGPGLAYSFCEVPNRGTVYATIPVCGSINADYRACRDGRIVEYDIASKRLVATHRFLSPEFYGRLELLLCLDDEVEVAVQATVYENQMMIQSAMSFSVADPTRFTPIVAGRELGSAFTYDAAHDALFFVSEFNNLLVRLDRATRQFDDTASQDLIKPWHEPITLQPFGGSYSVSPQSVHLGRNRLYVVEWMNGRFAHAIDLTTLRKVASYDVGSGAGLGVSVDPERDRLFVSSLWGLEVFDLKTDALVMRKRLGLGNRPVVIDAARNRLYLSSMVEGKIRILDRDTLAVVGQIPIGIGSRFPLLTRDGTTLFASSMAAHWAFDPDRL